MIELTEEMRKVLCDALVTAAEVEDKEINRCLKAYGKTVNGEKLAGLTARIDVSYSRINNYMYLYLQLKMEDNHESF